MDQAVVRLALTGSFATSLVLEIHGERMIEHNFTPGGRAALHAKDAHIIPGTAAKLGLALPVFSVVADQFDSWWPSALASSTTRRSSLSSRAGRPARTPR